MIPFNTQTLQKKLKLLNIGEHEDNRKMYIPSKNIN